MRKFRFPIAIRIALLIIFLGTFINILIWAGFQIAAKDRTHDLAQRNIVAYSNYLINELGNPPDISKIKSIADNRMLAIAVFGKGISLLYPQESFSKINIDNIKGKEGVNWARGLFTYTGHREGYTYIIMIRNKPLHQENFHGIVVVILVSIVFIGAYFLIRRMLVPLKDLTGGVEAMGQGDFQYQVPVRSNDEFGDLAKAFNSMNDRIGTMLRLKEQLLVDVSHELRSPLARMKVALELPDNDKLRKNIHADVDEMQLITHEILQAYRLGNHKDDFKTLDPAAVVRSAAGNFPGNGRTLIINKNDKSYKLNGSFFLLTRMVINLIENAFKYSKEEDGPVTIDIIHKSEFVIIKVTDHGVGIDASHLPFVFDPFYRIDPSRDRDSGGYGLGLYLCKRIMEQHGGNISIESSPGNGTALICSFQIVN
jgi:signal transduction histidine kinase